MRAVLDGAWAVWTPNASLPEKGRVLAVLEPGKSEADSVPAIGEELPTVRAAFVCGLLSEVTASSDAAGGLGSGCEGSGSRAVWT